MNKTNSDQPVYSYLDTQAVEDGLYEPVLEKAWPKLTHGKPIYITPGIKALQLSEAAYIEIWNEFVIHVKSGKSISGFETKMNGERIWVGDNQTSFCIYLPEEY